MSRWLVAMVVLGGCGFTTPGTSMPADGDVDGTDAPRDAPAARCGDGIIDPGEECEPVGPQPNGCTMCQIDPGWLCPGGGLCKKVSGVALAPREALPSAGTSGGGATFAEMCGPGHAIVGLEGESSDDDMKFGKLRAACGTMMFGLDGRLAWTAPQNTPYHGTEQGGGLGTVRCASDSVVVGYTTNANQYLSGIKLHCANLAVLHGALVIAPPTVLPVYGPAQGTDNPPADCAAGEVTAAYEGAAGSVLDHFDLRCFAVTLKTP